MPIVAKAELSDEDAKAIISWALQHYSSRRIIFLLGRAQKGACLPVDEQSIQVAQSQRPSSEG